MNVWTYWAGPMPAWIKTCLDSIRLCCKRSTFCMLTPDVADHHVGDILPPRWRELPPGVGTDCLRAALLARYGGLWMDADTVCIEDPIRLITNRHSPEQFLYSRWPRSKLAIAGYVYSPKGHPVAMQWLESVQAALQWAENVGWGGLGERMLSSILQDSPAKTWVIPLETFLPVDIDTNVARYFEISGWRDFATQNTLAFGLNYSWMNARMSHMMGNDPKLMVNRLLEDAEEANCAEQARQA